MTTKWKRESGSFDVRPSFLPIDLDATNFIDVTEEKDEFKVFLDPDTGDIHDGNKYYAQYLEEM